MGLAHSPTTVMDGLVLYLDAANPKSYTNYNLATYSQDFENAVYSKSLTITSTGLLAPDGTLTASTLTDNSNTVWQSFSRSFTVNNDNAGYNISIYIKKTTGGTSTRTGFNVSFTGGTAKNYNIRFNADTGVATGGDSSSVTTENNDYWRLSFAITNNSTGNTTLNFAYYPATGFYNGADDATATGSHTVWGLQVTRGAALLPYKANSNDSVTTWLDLSSNGKNVTLINGPTFIGNNMGAMSFDGIDDYVAVQSQQDAQLPLTGYGNFTGADTSSFTISLWVSTTQLAGTSAVDAPALVGRDNGDLWANLNIYNGYVYYLHYNGAWVYNIVSNTMIATGSWYNVVYVNNTNETGSLYINGIPEVVNQSSSLSGANYFSPDYIGRGYNGRYFSGKISSVYFYDRSLSMAEIQQNFNALRGRYGV